MKKESINWLKNLMKDVLFIKENLLKKDEIDIKLLSSYNSYQNVHYQIKCIVYYNKYTNSLFFHKDEPFLTLTFKYTPTKYTSTMNIFKKEIFLECKPLSTYLEDIEDVESALKNIENCIDSWNLWYEPLNKLGNLGKEVKKPNVFFSLESDISIKELKNIINSIG